MSDERLDRSIDEIARQMTEGEPPGDFRARVLAQLGDRPRRTWTIWTLAPVAAAALVIVSIFVMRSFRPHERAALQPSSPSSVARAAPPVESARRPDPSQPGAEAGPSGPAPRLAQQRGHTYATTEIDALAPPRLEVAPLGLEVLPTASIAVPQLDAIAPIAVEPLPANEPTTLEGDSQ
jgi:hypothetical protein